MRTANVLSINGGGIRGVLPLTQLVELEKVIKVPLYKHFDIIAGTSTGGIVATFLSLGFTASELMEIYTKYGEKIFQKRWYRLGLFRSKYNDKNFNRIIEQYAKGRNLYDCKTKLIVPTYNATKKELMIFKSWKDRFQIHDVVRSTSSAPSYFDAWKIGNNYFVDGGLVVNNPSMIAYMEAKKLGFDKVNIISFSTGEVEKPITKKQITSGILGWGKPTVDILLTEQASTTDYFLNQIYNLQDQKKGMYVYCESYIKLSNAKIDDASKINIDAMILDGKYSASRNKNKMYEFYLNTIK